MSVGIHYVQKIEEWFKPLGVCESINLGCFRRRRETLAYDEYTNSLGESAFGRAKHRFAPVHRRMGPDESTSRLTVQAQRACHKFNTAAQEAQSVRYCAWSTIPTLTSELSQYGAGLTECEWNKRFDYFSILVGVGMFRVATLNDVLMKGPLEVGYMQGCLRSASFPLIRTRGL